jgi:hypothetical protein
VTVITPGVDCSITSTATVSIAGAADGFTFRATFFTDAGLGLALATVRFVAFPRADLATFRALARAAVPLGSFPRFCTFDRFLRLVMIAPLMLRNDTTVQVAARYQTRVITRFQLERDRLGAVGLEVTKKHEEITVGEPSLGIWTRLGSRGVAPQMRDQGHRE